MQTDLKTLSDSSLEKSMLFSLSSLDDFDLETLLSKTSIDETDEGRKQLVGQKAPEAKKPIEEKKDTVTIIVANSDQQHFVDIMLQSPLKGKYDSMLLITNFL